MTGKPASSEARRDGGGMSKAKGALILVAILLAALALYLPVARYGYVQYDDITYVRDNGHIRNGLTARGIGWALTAARGATWQPLVWLSFMADASLGGMRPAWFHLTNLGLHLANAALLFILVMCLSGSLPMSGMVASLFALHPIHVEDVAWISARKDVLSTLFFLLSLILYCRYVRKPSLSRYSAAVVIFGLGLAAKPMLITMPFLLLLLDYWPLGRLRPVANRETRAGSGIGPARTILMEKLPFLLLALFSSVVTYAVQQKAGAVGTLADFPLRIRIFNAALAYLKYLRKLFWPLDLAVAYPMPQDIPSWKGLSALAILAAVSVLVTVKARKTPHLAVGWLWYFIALIPVIQLIPIGAHAMADRFAYIPFMGIYLALAWTVSRLKTGPWRIAGALAAVSLIVFSAGVTRFQVGYWRDSEALFERALAIEPLNYTAHIGLGTDLKEKGDAEGAMEHYRAAREIDPKNDLAYTGIGALLLLNQQARESLSYFSDALRLNPRSPEAHVNMGVALEKTGADPRESMSHYRQALAIDPEYAGAHYDLGRTLSRLGQNDEAAANFEQAIALKPDYADAHYNLALICEKKGDYDKAIEEYRETLTIDPRHAMAHNNLGVRLALKGDLKEAIRHFSEALEIQPDYASARENLRIAREQSAASGSASRAGAR